MRNLAPIFDPFEAVWFRNEATCGNLKHAPGSASYVSTRTHRPFLANVACLRITIYALKNNGCLQYRPTLALISYV